MRFRNLIETFSADEEIVLRYCAASADNERTGHGPL